MKRTIGMVLLFAVTLAFFGCSDSVLNSLPDYESRAFYTTDGIQDYTDYGKYTYRSVTAQDLEDSGYFSPLTDSDIEEILLYIEDFEVCVSSVGGELEKYYDFDKALVSKGDYFYFKTKPIDDKPEGKFADYTLYYFHIQTQTLYYFHNNV